MVTVAIAGLGARGGYIYSAFQKNRPDLMKTVAIADLKEELVEKYGRELGVKEENRFSSAEELLKRERLADVVIIATQDRDHFRHAMAALEKGYHILLEKPVSPRPDECVKLERAAKKAERLVAVCHVLRYTAFFRTIKKILSEGRLGQIRGIEQTENVAYWHYAHSFIRGNWRNSDETSPMILQKCCHDFDIIQWLIEKKPVSVSSRGELKYFVAENAPDGSTERCMENCSVKEKCPYNAERFYLAAYEKMSEAERRSNWIFNVLCNNSPSYERMKAALRDSDYGKCAFRCDNNVVDHQVTTVNFEDGTLATLTMTAFTKDCKRVVRIYGTEGELTADDFSNVITLRPFTGEDERIDVTKLTDDLSGHGGGDNRLMEEFLTLIDGGDFSKNVSSGIEKSVMSHMMAFAAEESRLKNGETIDLEGMKRNVGED